MDCHAANAARNDSIKKRKGAKKDSKDSKKDKEAKTTKSKNMRFV